MPEATFTITPGYGTVLGEQFHYAQAVRIDDRIDISGQGGWDDELAFPETIAEEIAKAAENVERTLATAGGSWADVVSVTTYHVPLEDSPSIEQEVLAAVVAEFKQRMPDRPPIWTAVAVPKLGLPGMRIEIVVSAVAED